MILGITHAMEAVSEYFLIEENLILLPEQLYMDMETKQTFLCFYPFYHVEIGKSLLQFAEYLLQKTDHADEKAVILAYEFYKQVTNEDYCFKNLIKRLTGEVIQNERKPIREGQELNKDGSSDNCKNEIYEKPEQKQLHSQEELEQRKKAAGREERVAFLVCTVILLFLIGFVLYLEIYEPLLIMRVLSYETMIAVIAITGALSVFFCISMLCRQQSKRNSIERRKEEQVQLRNTHAKKHEADEMQKYCGETKYLGQEEPIHRLVQMQEKEIKEIRLTDNPFIIGKKKTVVNGVISNPAVSRMHAKIQWKEGIYYLEDLNSTNGTSRNGIRLNANESVELSYNDELNFAGEIFYFR